MLALGAEAAQAENWRAVSLSSHDVVFVDADSVRRQSDGRIAFRARHRLAENDSNRDFGYNRIDLAVRSRCGAASAVPPPASSVRKYFLAHRPVAAVGWRDEEVVEDAASLAQTVCRGLIGFRSWADLDDAMIEYGRHDSLERLAAYVTGESELTGIVVQGFEMNAVALCGEDGCGEAPTQETCWLDGGINVPAPSGAPEWVNGGPRRDSAGAIFRGRIHRSQTGRGFGHLRGWGCLVEVTGPARFVEIVPPPRPRVAYGAAGARPEAVAAHAAFAESIKAASPVKLAVDGKHWTVDDFGTAAGPPSGGACYSLPRFSGDYVKPWGPALGWPDVREVVRRGAAVTVAQDRHDSDLDLYLAHDEAAQGIAAFVRRLKDLGVSAIAQKGLRVTVAGPTGSKETLRFADAAEAVRAAGIVNRLLGREIAEVKQSGNRVTIRRVQRQTLTFTDEAGAAEAERRILALRAACA
ncbi:MAG TPA: hypothetical protein VF782_01995 [Allosphingosinicella sp.]|jgi:hypothetical protein